MHVSEGGQKKPSQHACGCGFSATGAAAADAVPAACCALPPPGRVSTGVASKKPGPQAAETAPARELHAAVSGTFSGLSVRRMYCDSRVTTLSFVAHVAA